MIQSSGVCLCSVEVGIRYGHWGRPDGLLMCVIGVLKLSYCCCCCVAEVLSQFACWYRLVGMSACVMVLLALR